MRCSCLAVVSWIITLYLCWREIPSTCARTTTLAVSPENSDRDLQTVQEQRTEKRAPIMADGNNEAVQQPPQNAVEFFNQVGDMADAELVGAAQHVNTMAAWKYTKWIAVIYVRHFDQISLARFARFAQGL